MRTSRLVPGRYPPEGTSAIADAIRVRRGARGLTPLDGALLHVPPVAAGWNSLLGAIRTKGQLPGDLRELMILRVAVWNRAAFEWIQHEVVGRAEGLTTPQLQAIRDINTLISSPLSDVLPPLHRAALAFADSLTRDVQIPPEVTRQLTTELRRFATEAKTFDKNGVDAVVQDLYVEASATIATYNMVSRFLVSTDVAGLSDVPVPWPADKQEHKIPFPNSPDHSLHVVTYITRAGAPWIILSNSLITDNTMWDQLLPFLLGPHNFGAMTTTFNVITFDQRGHGSSGLPPPSSSAIPTPSSPLYPKPRQVTIAYLAHDIAHILKSLSVPKVHAAIGVSQGGAAVLAFGSLYPDMVERIIACDTGPRTAPGNKEAWDERIELAKNHGMNYLGKVTAERWFPIPNDWTSDDLDVVDRLVHKKWARELAQNMVANTNLEGFAAGASALQDYQLLSPREDPDDEDYVGKSLLECGVKSLLVAGNLDGDGKVAKGMSKLADDWMAARFVEIEGAGHLPMIDATPDFWRAIEPFLLANSSSNETLLI